MVTIQGAVERQGRWLSYTNSKGRRVSLAIDHIAHIYVNDGPGPYLGLTFVMVNDRETTVIFEGMTNLAAANQTLDAILKEISA